MINLPPPTLMLAIPHMTEIIIIVVVLLLIFGPKALPSLGRSMGKSLKEFKEGVSGNHDRLDEERKEEDNVPPQDRPPHDRRP